MQIPRGRHVAGRRDETLQYSDASLYPRVRRNQPRTMREPHNGQHPVRQARMGGSDRTELP